jgi:bifunctional N-acetylglucosamine-1-phosphate-uridyltransferase/glucosamine-1-phosphate-acetyltransferase GlmU-like protein
VSGIRPAAVIVLAAGEGRRMKSRTPKVLQTLCGRSMLGHVLAVAADPRPDRLIVVAGQGRDQMIPHIEIGPGTQLEVRTAVEAGTRIGPGCPLADTSVAKTATVTHSVRESARIGAGAVVGPFAHLGPGSEVPGSEEYRAGE